MRDRVYNADDTSAFEMLVRIYSGVDSIPATTMNGIITRAIEVRNTRGSIGALASLLHDAEELASEKA